MDISIGPASPSQLRFALVAVLILMVNTASAKPDNVTDSEMNLLPKYCPDTMGFNYGDAYSNTSPRASHWVSLMGKSFWAMHHYCWGLINLNRSRKAGVPAGTRKAILESVRGDFLYVIRNSTPDFIMLPELYSKEGEVELLLGKPGDAKEAFAMARKLKPDYWPAYSHWGEFLIQNGQRSEALKIVAMGLAYSPNAKVLQAQFKALGGKPSDIPKIAESQNSAQQESMDAEHPAVNPEKAQETESKK